MPLAATILLLALTRAEILERMRAPVVTQADGYVQVFAGCPEDMRREYQMPVARFAADTVRTLRHSLKMPATRFPRPRLVIHIGDVRTNLTDVISRVSTNRGEVVTRIYLKAPGFADLDRFRLETVRAFYRSERGEELSDRAARAAFRRADPRTRVRDDRAALESWLAGRPDADNPAMPADDEAGLTLMRKVIEPGRASRRDVLTFASRLFLYPPTYDLAFAGRFRCLSFREAVDVAAVDPSVRLMASLKAGSLPVFGCGRGDRMTSAVQAYTRFLLRFAESDSEREELLSLLEDADIKLNQAFEAVNQEES